MAAPDPTEARFPAVPVEKGHYESFYVKACHPDQPLAVWIRYTVHKRAGALPNGSLWVTLFDGSAEGPRAHKETTPAPGAGGGDWIRVGEASMRSGAAAGAIDGAEWDLRFAGSEPPLLHLPRAWMYRAPLPRTKLLSPVPAARFDGSLRVDGRTISVDGWRGMVGHNWGAQHAERWIWLHGLTESGDWIDAALGKVKLGRVTTPWVAGGALSLGGRRHALGGPGRKVEVSEGPDRCDFLLTGKAVRVRGSVAAPRKDFVGWVYADPDGSEHNTVNCSIADMRLQVEGSGELVVAGAAAYELGMRERDHGMPIQPFGDG
ncbi:MAG: hypothetical protein QOK00_1742 [Thermoleophilaceae bacterium]|nr:hypothetical protein [Thermoleophilaceae bacterium]